ncbi:type II secretion system F family protein [Ideonella azotifigens]|uniref:type II secretion system F family protein n=1 Tax=Ideonella azotifigens TaxID=513160 RepID=UPI00114347EA|nr:type II secretion system F family protein [Ideonella azotifigens]MCD2343110.1 type II secretion system F family protein [Ideonella azotifigens]
MATYAWRGRNSRGELITGNSEAESDNIVADQLLASGVTPIAVTLTELAAAVSGESTGSPALQALLGNKVTGEDTLVLSRQLYTLQKAGVPLLRSLNGLQASSDKPALTRLLADLRASLDQGRELSAALARHPDIFSAFYVAMVQVGEMTGKLTEVFQRLADHMAFELDTRARIKQALRYPMMVGIAIVAALVVINIFVLPTFATMFAGFKTELPLMTRVLLGVSSFTVHWWPLLLAGSVGGVMLLRQWLATPEGRYLWDRKKLRLPIIGPIVLKATLARFARSFAMASKSGVPISQAMTVVARTVDNAWIGSRVEQMRDGVERGESISRCAATAGVFTPVVLQMIAVGEETGELDTLLVEIADMYERETDHAIKGLSSAIEPILLLVIGAMVLVLALGVFMPLWGMGQAAMGHSS